MFPSTSLLTDQPGAVLGPHGAVGRAGADHVGQRHGAVAGAARAVVVAVGGAGREDERAVGPRRAVLHRAQHRAAPRQLRAQRRQRRRRQGGAGVPAPDHRPDHGLVAVVLFEPVRHPRARDDHVGPAGVVELQRPGDDRPAAIQNVRGYSSSLELFNKIFVPDHRRAGAARADRRPRAGELQPPAPEQPAAVGGGQAAPRRPRRAHRRAAAQADHDRRRRRAPT